jgi:hypothetical protein
VAAVAVAAQLVQIQVGQAAVHIIQVQEAGVEVE